MVQTSTLSISPYRFPGVIHISNNPLIHSVVNTFLAVWQQIPRLELMESTQLEWPLSFSFLVGASHLPVTIHRQTRTIAHLPDADAFLTVLKLGWLDESLSFSSISNPLKLRLGIGNKQTRKRRLETNPFSNRVIHVTPTLLTWYQLISPHLPHSGLITRSRAWKMDRSVNWKLIRVNCFIGAGVNEPSTWECGGHCIRELALHRSYHSYGTIKFCFYEQLLDLWPFETWPFYDRRMRVFSVRFPFSSFGPYLNWRVWVPSSISLARFGV